MNTRPVIFTAEQVRAARAEQSVQLKRPVLFPRYGGQRSSASDWCVTPTDDGATLFITTADGIVFNTRCGRLSRGMQDHILRCPFGVPGDRLWVRETWGQGYYQEEHFANDPKGRSYSWLSWVTMDSADDDENYTAIWYYADGDPPAGDPDVSYEKCSPVEMPRIRSRITMEVTKARAEQQQGTWVWAGECKAPEATR